MQSLGHQGLGFYDSISTPSSIFLGYRACLPRKSCSETSIQTLSPRPGGRRSGIEAKTTNTDTPPDHAGSGGRSACGRPFRASRTLEICSTLETHGDKEARGHLLVLDSMQVPKPKQSTSFRFDTLRSVAMTSQPPSFPSVQKCIRSCPGGGNDLLQPSVS